MDSDRFIQMYDFNLSQNSIKEVGQLLKNVPKIYESLEHVRNENAKHSQYATVMENLKHIFSVQSSVTKTIQWIEDDKLLNAHQCLTDLENSRDDILFELHKLPKQYALDKMTLKTNFAKVESVSDKLGDKIRIILDRCLTTVRKEPTIIVTAMRIIKREETADTFALQVNDQMKIIKFSKHYFTSINNSLIISSKNNKLASFHRVGRRTGAKWPWMLFIRRFKLELKAQKWKNDPKISCGWFMIWRLHVNSFLTIYV